MHATDLTTFATRYAAAWSSQDPNALASFYAENGSLKVNAGAPFVGRTEIAAAAGGFMAAFPDMVVALESVSRDGARAIFHWRWTGTNTGPGGTGRSVDLRGYEEWTLDDDGLIAESLGHYDEAEYERQMGGGKESPGNESALVDVAWRIRAVTEADVAVLEDMQYEAFSWNRPRRRPPLSELRHDAEFVKLLRDWGRPGDRGVLVEEEGAKLGAAWYRLWTPEVHSYGFVDARTPEVAMGVAPAHRSRGIGRTLLRALIRVAEDDGHPALSLSVDPGNHARRLYESEGFRRVGESGTSWTLRLALPRRLPG